jgi:hypothetical protein
MSAGGGKAWGKASRLIGKTIKTTLKGVEQEVASRSYRASNELRNSALFVLRGKRSGRVYRVPGTGKTYTASAPGEPPAVRTGAFRLSWGTHVRVERYGKRFIAVSAIESGLRAGGNLLGDMLEGGTSRMAPRPYKDAVKNRAMPKIKAIYK